jgi:hypothetical protein
MPKLVVILNIELNRRLALWITRLYAVDSSSTLFDIRMMQGHIGRTFTGSGRKLI